MSYNTIKISCLNHLVLLDQCFGEQEIVSTIQAKVYYLKSTKPQYVTVALTETCLYVLKGNKERFHVEAYPFKKLSEILVSLNPPGKVNAFPHFSLYSGRQRTFLLAIEAGDIEEFLKISDLLMNQIMVRNGKKQIVQDVNIHEWLAIERKRWMVNK